MDDRERARYDMLISSNQFGADNAADFSAFPAFTQNLQIIGDVIANLRNAAAVQTSGAVSTSVAKKAMLRDAIRAKMLNISRTARPLALDDEGLDKSFRMPRSRNDQLLIASAREFVSAATERQADFTALGISAEDIAALTADIGDFELALNEKATANAEKVGSTAQIDDELERGLDAVRRLDAVIRNVYRGNPQKLAEWQTASHVRQSARPITPPAPQT